LACGLGPKDWPLFAYQSLFYSTGRETKEEKKRRIKETKNKGIRIWRIK
jgi:hypothetical protein